MKSILGKNCLHMRAIRAAAALLMLTIVFSIPITSAQTALAESAINLPMGSYITTGTVSNPKAGEYLNLRALPSMGAAALAQYKSGERVEVWGKMGDWSLVRVLSDNRTGYMMTAFLTMDVPAPVHPVKPGIEDAWVSTTNGGRLNLRETPAQASRSLGLYYNGVLVRVLSYVSDVWAQVSIGEGEGTQYGYMQRQYLLTYNEDTNRGVPADNTYTIPSFVRPMDSWPMYAQPSDGAQILSRYSPIQPVEVLAIGAGVNERWWHVRFPGDGVNSTLYGFIPADDESLLNHQALAVNAPGPSYTLNLRNQPSYDGAIVGQVYNGSLVTALDNTVPNWTYVCVGIPGRGTVYGYMVSDLLVMSKTEVRDRRPVKTLRDGASVPMVSGLDAQAETLALYKADGRQFTVLGVYGKTTQVYDWQMGLSGFFETRYLK
ncbi:hypothetical protein FACS1894184_00260 [Clostridia bacterium]|nr:hypothetical protein FACS1894184_00260 [Clostridia bacterium]